MIEVGRNVCAIPDEDPNPPNVLVSIDRTSVRRPTTISYNMARFSSSGVNKPNECEKADVELEQSGKVNAIPFLVPRSLTFIILN